MPITYLSYGHVKTNGYNERQPNKGKNGDGQVACPDREKAAGQDDRSHSLLLNKRFTSFQGFREFKSREDLMVIDSHFYKKIVNLVII